MVWKERFFRFRSFWIFPVLAVVLISLTRRWERETQLRDLVWLFPLGVASWTLLEYGLHRFVFHRKLESAALRRIVNGSHFEHHELPRDVHHLLVHTPYSIGVSAVVYLLLVLVVRDWFRAMGVMAGIWAGFLYYESVHYRVHLSNRSTGLIGLQRRAHFYHHFRAPDRCFGVTTPIWDYVFGTRRIED